MSKRPNATAKWLSADDFKIWMKTRGLNWGQLGRLLGVSAQAARRYADTGLNRTQALALTAIEHGLKPWQPSDEDRFLAAEMDLDHAPEREDTPALRSSG